MIEKIKKNVRLFQLNVREDFGVELSFDEEAVKWIDSFVNALHEGHDFAVISGLASGIGCYLGQCILETYGGKWVEVDGNCCVRVNELLDVYPVHIVTNHLKEGQDSSIYTKFALVGVVRDHRDKIEGATDTEPTMII